MNIFKTFINTITSEEFLVFLKLLMLIAGIFLLVAKNSISNKVKKYLIRTCIYVAFYVLIIPLLKYIYNFQ